MALETFVAAVTGPLGALALAVGILWWLATRLVPVFQAYLESQAASLKNMVVALEKNVAAHERDRKMFEAAISQLDNRLDRVESDIHTIKNKLVP
jgi:hypothetical protein